MSHLVAALTLLLVIAHTTLAQSPSYIAEGYFVVDDKTVQRYVNEIPGTASAAEKRSQATSNINTDIDYILTEVNSLLATLQAGGVDLQIRKRSVHILSSNVLTSGFTAPDVIPLSTAIPVFKNWLDAQNSFDQLNFDFAIHWTGYNLFGNVGVDNTGGGYIGGICDGSFASAVVEFNATYVTAIDTARQIAFIVGASEDGLAFKNVMSTPLWPEAEDRWEFSTCAATDIQAFINQLNSTCLLQTSGSSTTPSTSWASYSGQLFDPDVICQRRFNDARSYMCKFPNLYNDHTPNGDTVCQAIYCWLPGTTLCYTAFTSEGLICNSKGRCDDGTCAPDFSSQSSTVNADCLWGDQKELYDPTIPFQGTCADYINQYGTSVCYYESVAAVCCKTCTVCDGPQGCECGDRAPNCADYPRSDVCPEHGPAPGGTGYCCEYCRGFVGKRSVGDWLVNASLAIELKDSVKVHVAFKLTHKSKVRKVN